jgi:hypothetical protein
VADHARKRDFVAVVVRPFLLTNPEDEPDEGAEDDAEDPDDDELADPDDDDEEDEADQAFA